MSDGQFRLTVEQFGRLEPHPPRDTRGKPCVDARRNDVKVEPVGGKSGNKR